MARCVTKFWYWSWVEAMLVCNDDSQYGTRWHCVDKPWRTEHTSSREWFSSAWNRYHCSLFSLFLAGISRDNWHKRRKTGGKRNPVHKKRKYELGRPPANTKVNICTRASVVASCLPRQCGWWNDVLRLVCFGRIGQCLRLSDARICHSYADTSCRSVHLR